MWDETFGLGTLGSVLEVRFGSGEPGWNEEETSGLSGNRRRSHGVSSVCDFSVKLPTPPASVSLNQ